jgi:hypothetical protein
MIHLVNLLRKHQKIIVLGVALGIVSLYFLPFDQIFAASVQERVHARFAVARSQVTAHHDQLQHVPGLEAQILAQLNDAEYRVITQLQAGGIA